MGASKFLQKKANTRAKEIDKKYGEGQYGGTWWQDMVKNNAEMGESPSESFLQRKMKELNSARTVKPESTQNVVSGSGGSFLGDVLSKKADCYITGDVKHDVFIDAHNAGLCVFDAGHFHTENIFCEYMKKLLSERFPDVSFDTAKNNRDIISYF